MGGFKHDIAGGQGNLVIRALQSPDFAAGAQGWQVRRDGSVEFNNGTFRGTVSGGVFAGTDFEINPSGLFFYSGPAGPGTLLLTIAGADGTDAYGTAYDAGVWLHGSGGSAVALFTGSGTPAIAVIPAGIAHATVTPELFGFALSPGAAAEVMVAALTSGKESGNDDAALQLFSQSADATVPARAVLEFGGTVGLTVTRSGPQYPVPPVYHAACTADLQVSAANADIAGANVNVPVHGNTTTAVVTAQVDAQTAAAAGADIVATLDWNGTTQAADAVLTANGVRATISQTWVITGLRAGSYNAKLQATGTSGGTIRAAHTSITVQVWEGS